MTTIYFVRHAHSTYTADELARPLSEKGESDAVKITKLLTEEDIDVIVSSPYKRAIQTVKGIAESTEKNIEIVKDLRERTLTKEPADNFNLAMTKVWEDPYFSWEGGESNVEAQRRGVQAIKILLNRYEDKKIVLGTHGNIMVLILNHFNQKYDYSFWKKLDMPDVYKAIFQKDELVNVIKLWNEN